MYRSDANSAGIHCEVDTRVYLRKALADAQLAYKDLCKVRLRAVAHQRLLVTIEPLSGDATQHRDLVLEFWNYALDRSCEEHLG